MPPQKSEIPYKKGDRVKARWSGSKSFYDAKVIEVFVKTCKVQFDDGTVSNVKLDNMKSSKAEKSEPSPKIEPSPKRTRSRSRSTGRGRSRSRSPARNEKKKSTSKNEKKTPTTRADKNKKEDSPKATNSVKKDETDSVVKSSLTREKIGTSKEETKTSVSSVTTTMNSFISKNLSVSLQRKNEDKPDLRVRSTRLAALRSSETSPSDVKITYEKTNAISKKDDAQYSDDEESEEEIIVVSKSTSKLMLVLTFIYTLLKIIIMPAFIVFLAFACTKRQCTVLVAPQFYSRLIDMVNALKITFPSIALFHIAISLLSLIPLGKRVKGFPYGLKGTIKEYVLSGLFCLIFSVAVFAICTYFNVYVNWGYEKFKSLALSAVFYCILFSLIVHIASLVKGKGDTESKIPVLGNFFSGTHLNPFLFGKIDLKTSFIRAGLIGSVILNLSILTKLFFMRGYITVPLALTAGMQIFFVLDYFIREEKMLSTATYTDDTVGFGFIMTTGVLVPFGLALQSVYLFIVENKAHSIPHWGYGLMVVLYLCGYYIYMSSSNLKHNFRRNPFSPSLSEIKSVPTKQKKRLISSKLWGIIRHPNYLGLIIMAIGWTLPCGFTHVAPFGPLAMLIIALIIRCFRIEGECKEKYGPAWKNYTEKARSRLIPFVF